MKENMINSFRIGKYLVAACRLLVPACCLLIALCGPSPLRAQNCPELPADCPVSDYGSLGPGRMTVWTSF